MRWSTPTSSTSLGCTARRALVDLLSGDGLDAARAQVERGAASFALTDCTLLPPIPRPTKILCVGVNYVAHAEEAGREVGEYPVIFQRYAADPGAARRRVAPPARVGAVRLRGRARRRDRERRRAHRGSRRDGARRRLRVLQRRERADWQFHTRQYGMGKNFLGSGGFGPWLVTADEVPDHHALRSAPS